MLDVTLKENRNNLLEAFDMDRPFPVYIKYLQDIQNYAEEGGQKGRRSGCITKTGASSSCTITPARR